MLSEIKTMAPPAREGPDQLPLRLRAKTAQLFACTSRLFFLGALCLSSGLCHAQAPGQIDNSTLIPKILPDDQVQMEGSSPDWVKSLIMAECRIETATPQGTFASATKVLDHYAEMGVNGLWIDPIYDRNDPLVRNGYVNLGPQTLYPALTGVANDESPEAFAAAKNFVAEAHRRNIRIFFDIIVWGTAKDSPLVSAHPEFYQKVNGKFWEVWGGYGFDWANPGLKAWFKDAAVQLIDKTGADGFRVDLAPATSGYFFKEIRDALYAEGRKIAIMSEINGTRRDTFDFEETAVTGWTERPDWVHPQKFQEQKLRFGEHNEYLFQHNIVDVVRSGRGIGDPDMQQQGLGGTFRFYTSNLLNHDDRAPFAAGNRVRFAYATIFAPFLPIWWMGEEWNNPLAWLPNSGGVMYFNTIDWTKIGANQEFYADVKKYLRIRRSYPEIFQSFSSSTRDANLAKLDTTRDGAPNNLQAYARFADGKAILIIPNYKSAGSARFQVNPDFAAFGLDPAWNYQITNLMTGEVVAVQTVPSLIKEGFTAQIEPDHLGIYLLSKK
jgi:hypothetical protein